MSDYFIREAGTYTCKIFSARKERHKNANEDPYIQFILTNHEGKAVLQNFLMTDKAMVAMRSVCRACGLSGAQAMAPRQKHFVDAMVEVDVSINEQNYPYVMKWRKATVPPADDEVEEEPEEDDFLF